MEFGFQSQTPGAALTILSGTLYDCHQPDCQDAVPQVSRGQQFCNTTSCSALVFSPYHRLEIQFSDGKTRQSNVFQSTSSSSTHTVYKVTIRPDDLLVETKYTSDYPGDPTIIFKCLLFLCGCYAGIAVIAILLNIFLARRSRRKK
jgi:hypothetical protein